MPEVQPKEHLRALTERAHRLLINDLKAIAEDKSNASPGGVARTALHIVAECAMVTGFLGKALNGVEVQRPPKEEREAHLNSFDTTEKVLAYLDRETQDLLTVIDGLDESTLGEVSDKPFGRPMSRFALAEFPALHMMYHDGQLNYIQTLHGDAEMHWG